MNDEIQHLNELREIHQRRLQILQKQAAKFGDLAVPAHLIIEIDELNTKILQIDAQLAGLDVSKTPTFLDDQAELVDLRLKLQSAFNLDELRTLCFDLGIDWENFPSLKEGFSRELIYYVHRREKVSELIMYCKMKRPNTTW